MYVVAHKLLNLFYGAVFFLGIFAAYYIAKLPRVLKGVLDVGVAWWKRSHIWIHENLLSAGTFAQKTRCGLCIAGTVTSALNCMLFSPGSQYHRFEAVQPSFFSSDPVLYSYVKMMFMQRMNKKNGTDIVCEQ